MFILRQILKQQSRPILALGILFHLFLTAFLLNATVGRAQSCASETEPNDRREQASTFSLDSCISAASLDGDDDYFHLLVNSQAAQQQWQIALESTAGEVFELCLLNAQGGETQCRSGNAPSLTDLILVPGDYDFRVKSRRDGGEYRLIFTTIGDALSTSEAEPNDDVTTASPLLNSLTINGRFVGEEDDLYRFAVTGAVERFRIEVAGEGIAHLALLDAAGNERLRRSEMMGSALALSDLYLTPGTHFFRVRGGDGSYTFRIIPLDSFWDEREPNDDVAQAKLLTFDEPLMGRLDSNEDLDLYRFSLATEGHILLSVVPPVSGDLNIDLRGAFSNGEHEPGQPFFYEAFLPAGDYIIQLKPRLPSIDPYTIAVELLNPFELPTDLEPLNNSQLTAPSLPPSFVIDGFTGVSSDRDDWYRLPTTQTASWVNVQVEGTAINLDFFAGDEELRQIKLDRNKGIVNGPLPAIPLDQIYVRVTGRGGYHLTFWFDNGPQSLPPESWAGESPAQLALSLPADRLAAFADSAQRMDGSLFVENITPIEQTLDLAVVSSNPAWQPQLEETQITLPPGESRSVPLRINVLASVPEAEVKFYASATNLAQHRATAKAALLTVCGIAPTGIDTQWTSAGALTGGLNVAWLALGGKPVEDRGGVADLIDDRVSLASGLHAKVGDESITFDLVGDEPITLTGVILNPLGQIQPPNTLRRFSVEGSLDGKAFQPLLAGELSPGLYEQPFVFAQPVQASFVRLTLIDSHKLELQNDIGLGEFKVIAQVGTQPTALDLDLANPEKGGHIVWADPFLPTQPTMLNGLGDNPPILLAASAAPEWVIGFYQNRAAQIAELQWNNPTNGTAAQKIASIDLYVSLDTPMGPWQLAQNWQLDPKSTGIQTLAFGAPIWARFLRFVATAPSTSDSIYYPQLLRIVERQSDATYQSILAEWGENRRPAIYERQQEIIAIDTQLLEDDANGENNRREQAQLLTVGQPINATVYSSDEDWFAIDVPAGVNTLQVTIDGMPVATQLLDKNGEEIDLTIVKQGTQRTISAQVTAGRYNLRISESPRSLLLAWDTTQSIAPYFPAFQLALERFTTSIDGQRQQLNLLPFGKPGALLLTEWSGDALALQQAFTNYGRNDYSNNAAVNLQIAAKALAQQDSAATIVLFSGKLPEEDQQSALLWQALQAVQPRFFAFSVDSTGEVATQTHLQDLATINYGSYAAISSPDRFADALAQVSCQLQETVRYQLVATTSMVAPTPTPQPPPTAQPTVQPSPTALATPQPTPIAMTDEAASDAQLESVANSDEQPTDDQSSTNSAAANMVQTANFPGNPGLLSVVGTTADGAFTAPIRNGSVEIILDASGSMMQTLDDRYRIDIAREVLTQLVTVVLDPETPLALRAFGHREPRSCRTDLEIPLARLDQTNAAGVIAGITPKNFGMTPIGASLAQVLNDMATIQGAKVILLVTDGEETCEGNPAAEIQRLIELDQNVRVNIVGFAVNDEATKKMFNEWASLGHGFYFDATNALELSNAMDMALQVPFRVYTSAGQLVTSGIVNGGKIEVPTGQYTIIVETEPVLRFDKVLVIGGQAIQLEVRATQ